MDNMILFSVLFVAVPLAIMATAFIIVAFLEVR
jgi:hypothetical protein